MARIIPNDIGDIALAQAERGELATLYYLKKSLPQSYHVFHGLHWTHEGYNGQTYYGEADFVIVNGEGKVLVIEQKDGSLLETDVGLVKSYGASNKDVSRQIHRTLDNLRTKYSEVSGGEKLDIDYLFYCPEYIVKNMKAAGLEQNRIVDAKSKEDLAKRIQELIKSSDITDSSRSVLDYLFDRYDIYPDMHTYKDLHSKAFTRLSGGLLKIISNIEMYPLRLRVKGVAGCGKSQLARHIYEKAISDDRRPMMICYTRPLKDKIESVVSKGGYVETWYGLCDKYLTEQGHKFDYERATKDPAIWKEMQEMVIASDIPDEWRFSTLIVEEGQDFNPAWYEVLELFLTDDADILWLEDAYQNVRSTDTTQLPNFVTYHAKENYRSPESIANFINDVLPFEFECMNSLPGFKVQVTGYKKEDEQVKIVGKLAQSLIKAGFKHEEIVVLTMKGANSSCLSSVDRIGSLDIKRFTGEYDNKGNQIFTDGRLYFESIRRFKGQQAPAVILIDVDPNDKDWYQHLLFTGMTRATMRLEIVMNQDSKEYAHYLKSC